jgi:hypothetical protein
MFSFFTIFFTVLAMIGIFVSVPVNMAENAVLKTATAEASLPYVITATIRLLLVLVAVIFFLVWTFRIVKNAHLISYHPLRFGPGWAVGFYFIPILCFFRPYQALSEAHRASKNPGDWESVTGSYLLGWWWAVYILSGIAGSISRSTVPALDLLSNNLDIIFSLTIYPLEYVLASLVVWKLCRAQQEAHQQVVYSSPPDRPDHLV